MRTVRTLLGCIHTAGLGGGRVFFKGAKMFHTSSPQSNRIFLLPFSLSKEKMKPFPLSVLMRNEKYKQYDEMVWRVMFKTEN